jgi:hypothetical protein
MTPIRDLFKEKADLKPILVYVSQDESFRTVADAVALCIKKGLLTHEHGYIVLPADVMTQMP